MNEENQNTDPFLEGRNLARASENSGQDAGTEGSNEQNTSDASTEGGNEQNAGNASTNSYSQDIYREGTTSYSGSYQENQGGYSYQGGYQYQNYDEPPQESMGFGIASMVLGIIALVLFCSCINILLAIASIIFGIIHLVNCKGGKGFAIAGIIMSVLSVIACIVMWVCVFYTPVFQEEFQRQMENQDEIYNNFNYPFDDDDYDYDYDHDYDYDYDHDYDHDEDDSHEFYHHDDYDNKTF